MIEASEMDGAGPLTTFWRIMLPTARPALSTLALLYFMWSWNQFLLALILIQDATRRTAPAGLGQFVTQYGKDVPLLSAATLIVIAPIVLIYLVLQRQLVRGILQGAVK
jgi:raffinose/stachyose/melibiose transport system permease protein